MNFHFKKMARSALQTSKPNEKKQFTTLPTAMPIERNCFFLKCLGLLIIGLASTSLCSSQQYIDLLKTDFGLMPQAEWDDDSSAQTDIQDANISVTYPIELKDDFALITGLDYANTRLKLSALSPSYTFQSATLKLGFNKKLSEKYALTAIALPKIAGQFGTLEKEHFQLGGLAMLKIKKHDRFVWKTGLYMSSEPFGLFSVPFFGFYFQSLNKRLEINTIIPTFADINVAVKGSLRAGLFWRANVRGYHIPQEEPFALYAHRRSQELGPYLQMGLLKERVLIRAFGGYAINVYESYQSGDEVDFGMSLFLFGDDRQQLNPDFKNSLFFRLGLVYRYHLKD